MIYIFSSSFSTKKTPDSCHADVRQGFKASSSMNRQGAAAEAECLVVKEEKILYMATRIVFSSGVFMEFSARRRGETHEGVRSFLPASMDCAPRGLEGPSPGLFASLVIQSGREDICIRYKKGAASPQVMAACRRQVVQKGYEGKGTESCGIAAFGGDEYIACVTGFPSRLPLVILSLRRRILVRAAYEANAIKYQSAGRLPIDSQPKIFRCSSALSPSSIPVGQTKGRSFMGRLREGFARLGNPMQDYQLGKR